MLLNFFLKAQCLLVPFDWEFRRTASYVPCGFITSNKYLNALPIFRAIISKPGYIVYLEMKNIQGIA